MYSSTCWDIYVSKCYLRHYHQNALQGLINLTHGTVEQVELAQFFWRHLEHDIAILGKAVGKSEDDVCMLLHLILKNMATKAPAEREYSLHFCLWCVNSILFHSYQWNETLFQSVDCQCQGRVGEVFWAGVYTTCTVGQCKMRGATKLINYLVNTNTHTHAYMHMHHWTHSH